jgi:hypothetical protein
MKKLVLTSMFSLAIAGAAFAQGSVNWGSINAGAFTAVTNSQTYSPLFGGGATGNGATGAAGGNASAGTGFYFELLYGGVYSGGSPSTQPTTLAALGTWHDSGLEATNSNTAGRATVISGNTGVTTPVGWNSGTTNYIMLVGWSANLGTTWSAASAALNSPTTLGNLTTTAYFGESTVGFITPLATGTSVGSALFGTAATAQGTPINSLLTPLYVIPVPEPGTMALAALGGASLLLFRRRK